VQRPIADYLGHFKRRVEVAAKAGDEERAIRWPQLLAEGLQRARGDAAAEEEGVFTPAAGGRLLLRQALCDFGARRRWRRAERIE
jgi:hypothetical protein